MSDDLAVFMIAIWLIGIPVCLWFTSDRFMPDLKDYDWKMMGIGWPITLVFVILIGVYLAARKVGGFIQSLYKEE